MSPSPRVYCLVGLSLLPIRICLHLAGWNSKRDVLGQPCILLRSCCNSMQSSSLKIPLNNFVSSAKRYRLELDTADGRSLMYITNISGPRTEP